MAEGRVVFEVVVEGKNVKVVQRQVEGVTDAVNDNTNAQDRNTKASRRNADAARGAGDAARAAGDSHAHFDRGLKGSSGSSSNATKNFSKMRDSMGGSSGLVGAYATLAANLFAATAAFTALQKAAGVEQLTLGLAALGASSGIAMMSVSKGLQEATGYAISLQDAMRSTAMVTSAGFDPSVIGRLGAVAKNTSIALGRDLQDSLNRVVKGAVKLEPELLDELGIMVKINEASQMYAQSLGKNASQLTNFEKRQGFMNAVLAEGEKKFGAIGASVGVNPYDKLLASLTELGTSVLGAFNVILTPIVNFLTQSKLLLLAFLLAISKGLVGAAIPALGQMAQKTAEAATRSENLANIERKHAQDRVTNAKQTVQGLTKEDNANKRVAGTAALKRAAIAEGAKAQLASIKELTAAEEKLKKQVATPGPKTDAQNQRLTLIEKTKKALNDQMKAEKDLANLKPASAAKSTFLTSAASRFESVGEDRSISNYQKQMNGLREDSSKFKEEVKAMGGQFTTLGRIITSGVPRLTAWSSSLSTGNGLFKIFGAASQGAASGLTYLATKVDLISAGMTSFGTKVKLGALAMFEFMGTAGIALMIAMQLYQGLKYLRDAFASPASKQYAKNLQEAKQRSDELTKSSQELNLSLAGNSNTMTTAIQQYDSQANIINQLSDQYQKLKTSANDAGVSNQQNISLLDKQIQGNVLLKRELADLSIKLQERRNVQTNDNETNKAAIGTFTSLADYIRYYGLNTAQATKVVEEFLKVARHKALALQNIAKSAEEATRAFVDYQNSFKSTTEFSVYLEKLDQVAKATESAINPKNMGAESAVKAQEALVAKLQPMGEEEINFYGEKFKNLRESILLANKQIEKISDDQAILSKFKTREQIRADILSNEGAQMDTLENFASNLMPNMWLALQQNSEDASRIIKNTLGDGALAGVADAGAAVFGFGVTRIAEAYSQLYGQEAKNREKVNVLLTQYGQESIGILTTQEQYNERAKKANIIAQAEKQGFITKGQQLSEEMLKELKIQLDITTELHRGAQAIENTKNKLESLKKIAEIYGYVTSSSSKEMEAAQTNLFSEEINLLQNKIAENDRFIKKEEGNARTQGEFISKKLALEAELAAKKAENISYENREAKRAAELNLKNYQYEADHQLEILKFLDERAKFATQELDTRKKSAELDAQIQSLKAGGTGDLSNAQQEQIFNDQFAARNAAIDKELEIKLQMFEIEQTINKAKMQILVYEIEAKKKEAQDLADQASLSAAFAMLFEGSDTAKALKNDAIQAQGVADRFGVMANQLYNIINDTTVPAFMKANIKLESENQKKALTVEQIRYQNNLDSEQIASDIAQAYSDAGSKLNDIVTKMIEARSSIIDSEQTILENQMKADNRKKTGKGELTAQQESDIANKYLKQRIDIIKEERDAKIKMIDLEYKLLEAKTKFEALSLAGQMQQMRDRVVKPKALSNFEAADTQDYFRQVNEINTLSSSIAETLDEVLRLIPGAKGLATKAASRAADAGVSTAEEAAAAAKEKANEDAKTLKKRAYETELEFIKSVTDLQQKILDFNNSILDNERTVAENAQKTANLRNKGIGKFELTAAQNAEIEVNYQEKRKALLLEEKNIKMATIEAEYGLLEAQLAVQKWRMVQDVTRIRDEARDGGINGANKDPKLESRMNTLLSDKKDPNSIESRFALAASLVKPAMVAAQRAAVSEYETGMSEATAAQLQAMEAAYGWTQKMTTSLGDVSTAIGQNFIATLENAKSITQELADAFTNSINASVDAFVDAFIEGKNIFKAMGDALRNSLRDSFAEAAKNKLKEGIAGIGSELIAKIAPGKGASEDFTKLLQSPQERLAIASESTTTAARATTEAVKNHTSLLQEIANNTARCCTGSMPAVPGATPTAVDYGVTGGMSPAAPKRVIKLSERQIDLSGDTANATAKTAGNVSIWGKLQEAATNNVGTIAATGFASMAAAIAAGGSVKQSLLGGVLGAVGAAVGMAYGGPAGSAAGQQTGGMLAAKAGFAKGGVMSSAGSMPLHKYGRGGVARTPQLAMFGEGSKPEAYVPLQDGRSIPVTMAGGSGNVNNISVNVAVDNKGGAQTQTQSGDNTEDYSRKLGAAISNAVKQEMMNQQRPGGLLYKGRR